MKLTILLPHYKVWKMTHYTVSQLIKFRGKHELEIIIIDNSYSDESSSYIRMLAGFREGGTEVTILNNPPGRMQSHGIAFDLAIPFVKTDYFITIESDSFPTRDNWLDYYESLINEGYDIAGSIMNLSGGQYLHPAGAMYKKSNWEEASAYCNSIPYTYFPNMGIKDTFPCHLMVRDNILEDFLKEPWSYEVMLHHSYLGLPPEQMLQKAIDYKPVTGPFHNGMGWRQESFFTYAQRNLSSEPESIILEPNEKIIYRMGYEPGQWFCYWHIAKRKSLFSIPTQVEWMPGRVNQQQEYTLMENGFTHIWGVSAYSGANIPELEDIVKRKNEIVEQLYSSLF